MLIHLNQSKVCVYKKYRPLLKYLLENTFLDNSDIGNHSIRLVSKNVHMWIDFTIVFLF